MQYKWLLPKGSLNGSGLTVVYEASAGGSIARLSSLVQPGSVLIDSELLVRHFCYTSKLVGHAGEGCNRYCRDNTPRCSDWLVPRTLSRSFSRPGRLVIALLLKTTSTVTQGSAVHHSQQDRMQSSAFKKVLYQ